MAKAKHTTRARREPPKAAQAAALRQPADLVRQSRGRRQPVWRALWSLVSRDDPSNKWRSLRKLLSEFYNFIVKVPWVIAVAVVAIVMVQGLTQTITVIEAISVPKGLAEKGYSAEVAARRLRDAMDNYASNIQTAMKGPALAMHGELPTVVVPAVGISLDAIVSSIRTVLHSTRSRNISGEITETSPGSYRLQLRLDNTKIALDASDGKNNSPDPDTLFKNAVPAIMDEIQPYLVAAEKYDQRDIAGANKKIEDIKTRFEGTSDPNLARAYNLQGVIYFNGEECKDPKSKACEKADEAFNKGLDIDGHLASAHINLGILYVKRGRAADAKTEFHRAIWIDDTNPSAYYHLADVLTEADEKEAQAKARRRGDVLGARLAKAAAGKLDRMAQFKDFTPEERPAVSITGVLANPDKNGEMQY
jgi:tetratricopeptide (TPR) repeat protein